jgi:hypothetical protein
MAILFGYECLDILEYGMLIKLPNVVVFYGCLGKHLCVMK